MTIRARLVVILIVTALMPLALTSLAHQVSIWLARGRLSAHARQALDTNARQALQEQLEGHVEIIKREMQLTRALLKRQAREIELALAAPVYAEKCDFHASTFGHDPNLFVLPAQYHPSFSDANDPNIAALSIDYQRQGYAVMPQANEVEVRRAQMQLSPMTRVYHEIYTQAPKGTLWLSTRLENGLITRYPAGGTFDLPPPRGPGAGPPGRGPRGFGQERLPADPGRRPVMGGITRERGGRSPRPRRPRETGGAPAVVDHSTGQVVVEIPQPIRSADGSMAGVAVMKRTVAEFFENMSLPERWGEDTERMIVQVAPNAAAQPSARILLHSKLDKTAPTRRRRIIPGRLESRDTAQYKAMIEGIAAGNPGVQSMEFQGRSCLWAYQPVEVSGVAALLIVPYTHITELAETMERTLIRESMFWLQLTTVVLVLATVYAIVLALRRARALTDPIDTLVSASRRLANGDFEAQVQIASGDELEHLGNVFNDIGPKLREHGNMKLSLELARAVQQNLLPGRTPVLHNLEVTGRCLYCDETGGDYYDFIDLSEDKPGRVGIVLGDVSGHGIDAALLMASIRGVTHAEARYYADRPAQMLARANGQVSQDTEDDRFVTLFYGLLEDQTRSCVWASAGHEPALWYHSHNQEIEELPSTGMPLGVQENATFNQMGPIHMEPGDVLIIGTDGIWDARNEQSEFYGMSRFLDVLKENHHLDAEDLANCLMNHVTGYIGSASRIDDITMVLIKAK